MKLNNLEYKEPLMDFFNSIIVIDNFKKFTAAELDICISYIKQIPESWDTIPPNYLGVLDLSVGNIWPKKKEIDYNKVEKVCALLQSRHITIEDVDNERGLAFLIFQYANLRIEKDLIRVELNRHLVSSFIKLKHKIEDTLLKEALLLRSHHAKKLYLLLGFFYSEKNSNFEISINDLVQLLGIPKKYNDVSLVNEFLKVYIISTIKWINKNSDVIIVDFEIYFSTVERRNFLIFYYKPKDKKDIIPTLSERN